MLEGKRKIIVWNNQRDISKFVVCTIKLFNAIIKERLKFFFFNLYETCILCVY